MEFFKNCNRKRKLGNLGTDLYSIDVSCAKTIGHRDYMEDFVSMSQYIDEDKNYSLTYFGVFDGHGGTEAAKFASDHLRDSIMGFADENSGSAISKGFAETQSAMRQTLHSWTKRDEYPYSSAGTTATVVFVENSGAIHLGHVGDSEAIVGVAETNDNVVWRPVEITQSLSHKTDNQLEKLRVLGSGGKLTSQQRVKNPFPIVDLISKDKQNYVQEEAQFRSLSLNMTRSLGNFWSINRITKKPIISSLPYTKRFGNDLGYIKSIVLASDGLWNILSHQEVLTFVQNDNSTETASKLLQHAEQVGANRAARLDNISIIVVKMITYNQNLVMEAKKSRLNSSNKMWKELQFIENKSTLLTPAVENSPFFNQL